MACDLRRSRDLLSRLAVLAAAVATPASAQNVLLSPDTSLLWVLAINASDGTPTPFTTGAPSGFWLDMTRSVEPSTLVSPRHAMQVGSEVWISDQGADRIHRFSAQVETPRYLGVIEGLTNPRGMTVVGDEVWISAADTPSGPGVARYSFNGVFRGSFSASNPFSLFRISANTVFATNIDNDRIERYAANNNVGTFMGNWGEPTSMSFPMQMVRWTTAGSDRLLVVANSPPDEGLYQYQIPSGQFLGRLSTLAVLPWISVTQPRGVAILSTGEIAWSSTQGLFALNPSTGISRTLYAAENSVCNFIEPVNFGAYCAGDLNNDRLIDNDDFLLFVQGYVDFLCPRTGDDFPAGCPADLTADEQVDNADFVLFVQGYNELLCP